MLSTKSDKLVSLLRRAGELYRLMMKSVQAPDIVASEFLHSKKHLKSPERRFISAAAFAAVRMQPLLHLCLKRVAEAEAFAGTAQDDPLRFAIAACVLGPNAGVFDAAGEFENVFESIETDEPFAEILTSTVQGALAYSETESRTWVQVLSLAFDECVAAVLSLLESRVPLSDAECETVAARYCIQPWILQTWMDNPLHQRTPEEAAALAAACMNTAPVDLRVNRRRDSRDKILRDALALGLPVQPCPISPDGLRLESRIRITDTDLYRDGLIEVQDEASQLVAYAVDPKGNWNLLDACTGAGGKALHLAGFLGFEGAITALDIEYSRLRALSARAQRSGIQSIRTIRVPARAEAAEIDTLIGTFPPVFDAVIVDAPCSGLGTVRRNPLIKLRLQPKQVSKLAARQLELLELYAEFVKDGGVLVYSTCSLLPQENEEVVQTFLGRHMEFVPDPIFTRLRSMGVRIAGLQTDSYSMTLTPSEHGTDGFFIARMRRKTVISEQCSVNSCGDGGIAFPRQA